MLLRLDDVPICADVYLNDEYKINNILLSKSAKYVVDVGAHVGSFTMKVADYMKDEAQIIAIEPHPENLEVLRLNVARTPNPENIIVVPAALMHKSAERAYLTDKFRDNTGGSSVRGIANCGCGEQGPRSIDVAAVYLPDVLQQHNFERIDLLKFDCEGCELVGIQSLKEQGWLDKIRWIRGEFHGNLGDSLVKLLKDTHKVVLSDKVGALGKFSADRIRNT